MVRTLNQLYYRNLIVEKVATSETFEDEADFVVSARGTLNEAKWPKIDGLQDFKGEIFHSSAWNDK
jgi:cation diffusion facilitator CzcD-associated flavoprotein CzcO